MATVELALVIPAAVFLAAALIGVVIAVGTQLRCVDAAREGARAAARGESETVVRALTRKVAPDGAHIEIETSDDTVTVIVTVSYTPLGGALGTLTLRGTATAQLEPDGSHGFP